MRTSGVPVLRRSLQLEQRGRHLDSNPHASWRQVAHTGVAVRAQRRCSISLLPPFRSQKFEPSTCGVEMPACGDALLPYLHGAPAGPVPAGRKPADPGARTARAFTGWRRSGPMATSRWGHRSPSQPRPALRGATPFDAARIAHDALDTAGAAQHFQLADMRTDVGLGVLRRSILTQCRRLQGARWVDKCLYHPRRHGY